MRADSDDGGRQVADGEAVQVHVASDTGRPSPIPAPWRDRLLAALPHRGR
jgi:acyl-CoA thioesterase FadM